MELSRRQALRGAAGVGASALAGCAALTGADTRLTLTLLNFDTERHRLSVELLRANGTERSESVVLLEEYVLPAPDDTPAVVKKQDVVESARYVVRAHLGGNRSVRGNFQFFPDCTGEDDESSGRDDEPPEELYVEVHRDDDDPEPYITFQQNRCGRDAHAY